ncbi:hypothetical protein [Cellulomonas sp. Y8]|uniref:hypothetical protein n=1 Tax=Cellulomonas sp. Y8 TaxID=2591145 RepID=UPI003D73E4B1
MGEKFDDRAFRLSIIGRALAYLGGSNPKVHRVSLKGETEKEIAYFAAEADRQSAALLRRISDAIYVGVINPNVALEREAFELFLTDDAVMDTTMNLLVEAWAGDDPDAEMRNLAVAVVTGSRL